MRHKFMKPFYRIFALALIALLAMPFAAFADSVQVNGLTVGGTDTFVQGHSAPILYRIQATGASGGDTEGGCNATIDSPATVNIITPSGITATPSSLSFNYCGNPSKPVVFTSTTVGDYNITATVTDSGPGSYNTSAAAFTLHVLSSDSTPPVLSLPASPVIAEATSAAGAPVIYSASATDAVDGSVNISCSPASGSTFALGSTTVNCSAKDSKNNTANGNFTVTVRDTTGPEISGAPADITGVEATSSSGATVTYTSPTANDAVDGARSVSCEPASGSTFALGTTTVNCSSSDSRGNSSSSSFTVLIQDTQAPVLVLPQAVVEEATSADGAVVSFSPMANDTVDGDRPVSCSPASGSQFPLGNTMVSCSASDTGNRTASDEFIVTVRDTTAPVIAAHDNAEAEATSANGAAVNYSSPATSDAVDGAKTASCSPASGSQFPLGATLVICNAQDAAGNQASVVTFSVSVVDTTPPTVSVPANITVEATGPSGAAVTFSATAHDIVDGAIAEVGCLPASGSTFALGKTPITCTANDSHNNIGSKNFDVTVVDTTAPVIYDDGATSQPNGSNNWYTTAVTNQFHATDTVGFDATFVNPFTKSSGAAEGSAVKISSGSILDAAANTASAIDSAAFKIDLSNPIVTCAPAPTFTKGQSGAIVSASVSDAVSGPVATLVSAAASTTAIGSQTASVTGYDNAGRSTSVNCAYNVVYNYSGFFQPIDNKDASGNYILNVAKAGSTIPIKFSLGGDQGLTIFAPNSPSSGSITCSAAATQDTIEELSTATVSGLKYDPVANQYIYNWKTTSTYAGTCRQLVVTLADGTTHRANFKFTK